MQLNAASLLAINVAINTSFNTTLTGVEGTHERVAMTVNSTTAANTYPKLDDLPGMREWFGDRVIHRLDTNAFTLLNRKFENTIAIPVDAIEDDQFGIYTNLASDFGMTAGELPDELVWEQLEKGFDTSHFDGQFFFDTDHPVEDKNGDEQSVSNFQGGAGDAWYLMDTRRVIKPIIFQNRTPATITPKTSLTDDNVFHQDEFQWGAKRRCAAGFGAWQLCYASKQPLTAANYAAARAAMIAMRGHRGRKVNIKPDLLVVNAANEGAGREILLSERDTNGATNKWRNTADLHVESRLS